MKQHRQPCRDCPWRRIALKGWCGALTPLEWLQAVHGEAKVDCHIHTKFQCAGAAIYRANVAKQPRDQSLLVLKPDTKKVFARPEEFMAHHDENFNGKPVGHHLTCLG